MKSFAGKVIWITGASSGIGEALAYEFSKQNCYLVLSARRENELQRVKQNCAGNKESILILPFDLADSSKLSNILQLVIQRFSRIDLLINNGGISQRAYAKDTSLEIDRKLMEVNYFSYVALTKSVLPFMIAQNSGHIAVTSSPSGKYGFFLRSGYAASKHALHGFFESLRLEVYNNNIQISFIIPGKIRTNGSLNALNEKGEAFNKMDESFEKGMSPEECARRIVKGLQQEKEEILIGGKEIMAIHLKRLFPTLFSRVMLKQKVE